MRVSFAGDRRALAAPTVRRVVGAVLEGERSVETIMTVTFLSAARMRTLNRKSFDHDRASDVIAFRLPHADEVFGDVYVCPAEARRSARRYRVPVREELIRLVIHGTLHVLGYDHPAGESRIHSSMWARQERYVVAVQSGAAP
ncbi:MAG: rRNA maturation RNase YbeY [Gemmatimonadetes bacterium]|nr:rRNA maturation RNase YbeY [Gemmatimonadota bacterium]